MLVFFSLQHFVAKPFKQRSRAPCIFCRQCLWQETQTPWKFRSQWSTSNKFHTWSENWIKVEKCWRWLIEMCSSHYSGQITTKSSFESSRVTFKVSKRRLSNCDFPIQVVSRQEVALKFQCSFWNVTSPRKQKAKQLSTRIQNDN